MSLFEKIKSGEYDSKVPFGLDKVPVDENTMTVAQAKAHVASEKERRSAQRRLYGEDQARLLKLFQSDLEAEYGVQNNPKAEMLFDKAYSLGKSYGYNEIECHYAELVDLIK